MELVLNVTRPDKELLKEAKKALESTKFSINEHPTNTSEGYVFYLDLITSFNYPISIVVDNTERDF